MRLQLLILCLFAVCLVTSSEAAGKRPPNIVLILADDLGVEGLNCYGGTSYRTPRLDQLAAEGRRFTQAYAQPLCTNTRIQLMTGLYNNRNWLYFGCMDPNARTFGHELQAAGYRTCMAGKWQLHSYDPPDYPGADQRRGTGMRIEDAGFDEYSVWHAGHTEDKGHRYADPTIYENGKIRKDTQGKYGEDLWVDFISDFIDREADGDQPFFVYYAMCLPHWPFVPTPRSEEWGIESEMHPPLGTTGGDNKYFPDMVSYMDEVVGRLVDHIEAAGLGEETLIIYYSDNGTDKRIISDTSFGTVAGGKGDMTRAGTQVPLIVRWTGTIEPGISDTLVDSTDFLPTFLAAAGKPIEPTQQLDGRSFYPLLLGQKHTPRKWTFCHFDPAPGWDKEKFVRSQSVHDGHYKLYDDGRLYDIRLDPLEQLPLRRSVETSRLRDEFQAVLDRMNTPDNN
ncbi:sulfatase-like hydrolase/transferase [Rubinisphaera margarita]|uniref:sulfatase-like hydrolase/transferase n=1 Tax=Rubinisphaera margarita TaxID=2909586 RepID=UPI001EE8FC62|nr:sulfatase-like hydrolase/transferase [Rubinisphaera margarita]MCG6154421.1 sulfatase-like hydrolase/transferase [Rubinisphaera margarita]